MAPGETEQPQAPSESAPVDSAPVAAPSPTLPPPEKPSAIRQRSYVVLSFWLVVLLLGLPIWWKTTAIYRADLPLDSMLKWADGKACRPVFPLQILIQADSLQEQEAQSLIRLTQHALDDLNDFSGHHLRLQLAPRNAPLPRDDFQTALTIRLKPGTSSSASLNQESAVLDITYPPNHVPSLTSPSSPLASYITNELRATFAEEQSIISYLLSTSSMSTGVRPQGLSAEAAEALSKRTTRSLRYAPTYHLTFSLFTGNALPNTWDIEAALDEYIRPMLDVLRPIHNFTIDTQVQLYAIPGVQSQVLSKDHLSSFINAAEWPLSPSIGKAPTVNFVIYVGNQTVGLNAEAETSQSWMIPQWGTVYLLSLPDTASHVSTAALKQPMLTFGGHLLSLLGTPQSGSLPLRLSTLGRIRSTDLLLRASSTLGSLARLSLALPSISIPRSVADGVSKAMHHLELACADLGGPEGLMHGRIAEEEAERAFFEKSMIRASVLLSPSSLATAALCRAAQNAKKKKMLPEPSFTLTIPSIHDGTTLDCRVYHPASLLVGTGGSQHQVAPWKRHAAVFAHPYAPMGGSFDDPLLDIVAGQLLRKGYLLGTFNFRGAGQSAGRTSWTAKPERDDYISFVGFMAHYIHRLDPFRRLVSTGVAEPPSEQTLPHNWHPILMMAGYSYGAMVTTQLPPIHELLEPFASPDSGSHAAQIRLRAESWAEKQSQALQEARAAMIRGEQRAHKVASNSEKSSSPLEPANGKLSPIKGFIMPQPAYLLVSPLQGLVTHLATMSLVPSVFAKRKPPQEDEAEAKLVQNPTLAVFGDGDIFVPVGKLRTWVGRLSSQPASQFQAHEIESAGHFWAEEGVLHSMLDLICDFAGKLYDSN
ncbi:phosphatidylinositol-glycan biosynthesis class s [Trichoderma arundinaceum]|uniref:Phosphatidylinositol-glycan biosynthesis class s n=1 Tax=Trichoderma arundinaceum TaxID=490622 RepID=A0A395NF89_TRIAR|nr:phosphatidylinositol-glycan biosynthesis class s [Trichoderma arundinaceum]